MEWQLCWGLILTRSWTLKRLRPSSRTVVCSLRYFHYDSPIWRVVTIQWTTMMIIKHPITSPCPLRMLSLSPDAANTQKSKPLSQSLLAWKKVWDTAVDIASLCWLRWTSHWATRVDLLRNISLWVCVVSTPGSLISAKWCLPVYPLFIYSMYTGVIGFRYSNLEMFNYKAHTVTWDSDAIQDIHSLWSGFYKIWIFLTLWSQ